MMETLHSSKTSVLTGTTRLKVPEDGILNSHHHKNLESYRINKGLEGNVYGIIDELSQNLPGRTEVNHENLPEDNQCPGQDSTFTPTKYESRMLVSTVV
jgi:hypothetical protein